ncbi:MAG: hypothetical protein ACK5KO_04965 [Arachnia sp.]
MTRARSRAWISFAALLAAAVALSLVGGYVVAHRWDPKLQSQVQVGEWIVEDEQGVRVRVDSISRESELPSYSDANVPVPAPDGFEFVRVLASVEVTGEPLCQFELYNGAGEQLTARSYAVIAGPASEGCTPVPDENGEKPTDFESQQVFVVLPGQELQLRVVIFQGDNPPPRYWAVEVP